MILDKEIQTSIEAPAFLFTTKLKLDFNYFKKRIEQGVDDKDNQNYNTNVDSLMTPWNYFVDDNTFHNQICLPTMDIIQKKIRKTASFKIQNAWGIIQDINEHTKEHNHDRCFFSGVVYLNDCKQKLYFDEIEQEIIPKKGLLVLFSSNLLHYTNRNTDTKKYAISFNYVRI